MFAVMGCSNGDSPTEEPPVVETPEEGGETPPIETLTDEEVMDLVQTETFKYFWDYAQSNSGAARERYHPTNPSLNQEVVTIGGTGFGLMAILVGIERGYISRSEGLTRLQTILNFLENADRFHGAWPHWLHGSTGDVLPFSEKDNGGDLVETAFLVQGLICIFEYFKEGSETEKTLATQADALWKGVEWDWYTNNEEVLHWHWSPNYNFDINFELRGYNEVLVTYILAASSPNHSITADIYNKGWARNGSFTSGNSQYGYPLILKHNGAETFGGPLFWAHYSYLGLDPRNLKDSYANYWNVNLYHTNINYQYCVNNPGNYEDYGSDCWGLTASYSRNSDGSIGYHAHRPGDDKGVISPTAAISSIPYMHYFYQNKDKLLGPAGFYDAFAPEYNYWVANAYLAIDQGPQIIMIENHRTALLWNLFMQNEDVKKGLDKLGFTY